MADTGVGTDTGSVSSGGGIEWPRDPTTGDVSTSRTNREIWLSFLSSLTDAYDDDGDEGGSPPEYVIRAREIRSQLRSMPNRDWRYGYVPILTAAAEVHACTTPDEAVRMARAGLNALHGAMTCRGVTAGQAVMGGSGGGGEEGVDDRHLVGLVVKGKRSAGDVTRRYRLAVPAAAGGNVNVAEGEDQSCGYVTGRAAKSQLEAWSSYGCMEPSAATSASEVVDHSDVTELVRDRVFVLLGATSELGPHDVLADLDATIVAVARRGTKLRSLVRRTIENTGATLVLPRMRSGAAPQADDVANGTMEEVDGDDDEGALDRAGADLIEDAPELARWISSLYPTKQLVLSCLAYLDGERNVRAAVGMDLICQYVCERRTDTALSFLISPATAHVIPEEAAVDSKRRYADAPWSHRMLFRPSKITEPLTPNGMRVYDGLAVVQGPNYALAKMAQQWRAIVAANADDGHVVVSANVAPAARTRNMVSRSDISAALEGMQRFEPFVAFDPEPAKTLMAALMLWDLNEDHYHHGDEENEEVLEEESRRRHPLRLFEGNAVHGGMWRCPYDLGGMGAVSYVAGMFATPGWCPEGSLATATTTTTTTDVVGPEDAS